MTPRQRHLSGLGLSLLAHGSLAGTAWWMWQQEPAKPAPEPIRWEISLYTPAPPAPTEAAVAPTPETPPPPKPKVEPKPKPKPKPKLKPVKRPTPKPVTRYLAQETPPDATPDPPTQAPTTVATTGPLTGIANPAPAVKPDPKPDFDWLRRYLIEQIRRHKQYPGDARRRGWEGQVLVRAVIGGNGQLVEAEIVKSSGHAVLDDEALATLRRAMPVPVSKAHGWSQVAVTIPFDYRLKR
ncbi:energy transducer TonB [Methylocaldum szegediense]|uniref:Protein TonB n=1 Tax=Methylocaldum szegediense TaxID=73780 RepID=A0ABM9HZY2_9GAMM|nr:energy transducer TonB [Methylocaldum szegediense]CAI8798912.1 periplasmic protein TonB [Methylocaldum szegediense]